MNVTLKERFENLFGRHKSRRETEALPTQPEPAQRDSERTPSFKDATVTTMTGQKLRAVAVDMDDHGARVRFLTKPDIGDKVKVSISGVCTQRLAKVMWRDRNDVGLRYIMDARPSTSA